ncbi:lysylphosphatidylglycerol synthase transmembrane domain-containing protein [Bifidobacterium asteroides]|uniref:lysylphosphatidylglycerol synthase transmembrane domain-containing protein n=1 Tax=Bifidobacterium asteroides TaxID=1684 RepID=UPI0018DBF1D5|nr:lysylphosphatidylglycerol synthase transmembrane domain-containing protein [Bifidobacterium asteroides]MBH9983385.1 flippase-like domain-containing protein [Bifidobacterium asteroides]
MTPSQSTITPEDTDSADPVKADKVVIRDTPPERVHDAEDLLRALAALILGILVTLAAVYLKGIAAGVESDMRQAGNAMDWLMDVPTAFLQQAVTVTVVLTVIVHLLVNREWIQAITAPLAMFLGFGLVMLTSNLILKAGNPTLIASFSSQNAIGSPVLLPDFYAGLAAFLSAAGPRRLRSSVKWGWNALYIVAIIMVAISSNSASGVLVSLILGRIIGMVVRYLAGTQNKGAWGQGVVQAIASIGIHAVSLERQDSSLDADGQPLPALADDLIEASRIYRVHDKDGRTYTVSVMDGQLHTMGYLMQLWQWIKLSGVSMRRDRSVRNSMQHHMAMLAELRDLGLTAMHPYGLAESAESSILVLEDDVHLRPLEPGSLDTDKAKQLMDYLRRANERGFTHRRIRPETLAVDQSDSMVIAGWENGDSASSQANIALDRIQLLALIATLIGVNQAIEAARASWGIKTLAGLSPFCQMVAIPSQTQDLPGWDRQILTDLRKQLQSLAPPESVAETGQVTLSRFSLRSFVALALLVVALAVIVTQFNLPQVISAVRNANPWMAGLSFLLGSLSWVGCAITLGVFIDPAKRDFKGIFLSQVASSFTSVSMPAGVGPAFVNLQFLRRDGYDNTMATAIMSAVVAVQFATTFCLLIVIGLFTGRNTLSGMIPTNTLVIVIGTVAIIAALIMAVPYTRRLVMERLMPIVASYAHHLVEILTQPRQLVVAVLGAVLQSAALGMSFWAALMAFGCRTNVFETTFVFLLANTLGSAVPTPGGLGAIEAVLFSAFRLAGVPSGVAISATLVFRVATYWLRIPLGALAMRWLSSHNRI